MKKLTYVELFKIDVRSLVRDYHFKRAEMERNISGKYIHDPSRRSNDHMLKALKHLEKAIVQMDKISEITGIPHRIV